MFKYDLGQILRIKAGIYEGHTFTVKDEDCVQINTTTRITTQHLVRSICQVLSFCLKRVVSKTVKSES